MAKFCMECGARFAVETIKFCPECGHPVAGSTTSEPSPELSLNVGGDVGRDMLVAGRDVHVHSGEELECKACKGTGKIEYWESCKVCSDPQNPRPFTTHIDAFCTACGGRIPEQNLKIGPYTYAQVSDIRTFQAEERARLAKEKKSNAEREKVLRDQVNVIAKAAKGSPPDSLLGLHLQGVQQQLADHLRYAVEGDPQNRMREAQYEWVEELRRTRPEYFGKRYITLSRPCESCNGQGKVRV